MAGLNLPLLSEYDPANSAEGALDPLGLYSISDALAMKLVRGVRERQSHPRYLTLMAVGAILTQEQEMDRLSSDGVSEPYIVYEWHAVEGLVRTRGEDPELNKLPGIRKVKNAVQDRVHLSASRYLKTPTVFGFHGVYRALAQDIDIIRDELLGEAGYQLLTIWEREQGLEGFGSSHPGPGRAFRDSLKKAIEDGLDKEAVDRSNSWEGFSFFGKYLFPNQIPRNEAEFIGKLLVGNPDSFRSQVIRFLASRPGQEILEKEQSERAFHQALRTRVDENLKQLLDAIEIYERFARLLQDAFDDCLHIMTVKRGLISLKELAKEKGCQKASEMVPDFFSEVADRLSLFGQSPRFIESFGALAEKTSVESWVNLLLEHHLRVQRNKPPNGKNPWFERYDDGRVAVRPAYRKEEGGLHQEVYVHQYRTGPLWSFLNDLKMLEK